MKEVIISETAKSVVEAKTIINKIESVNKRYEASNQKAKKLYTELNKTKTSISKTESAWYKLGTGYNSTDLYNLIQESHEASLITTKNIYELIKNNNENSKQLSEMVSALAMLSGLSFKRVSENTAQLEELANSLESSEDNTGSNSIHIKRVVLSQINKVKEDKKRQEEIDYNIGILNENIKELEGKINDVTKEFKANIKQLNLLFSSSSEEHFLRVLKKNKILIKFILYLNVLFVLLFLFLFYQNNIFNIQDYFK